ncbi:hypothetical protein RJT34_12905 [Clitoria ternatea]|uniref:Uncharacterized protein n=1 Tax=Clitoria ternatea TaxID=43366 RepID=A0AAN9JPY9_CLITE
MKKNARNCGVRYCATNGAIWPRCIWRSSSSPANVDSTTTAPPPREHRTTTATTAQPLRDHHRTTTSSSARSLLFSAACVHSSPLSPHCSVFSSPSSPLSPLSLTIITVVPSLSLITAVFLSASSLHCSLPLRPQPHHYSSLSQPHHCSLPLRPHYTADCLTSQLHLSETKMLD